MQPFSQLLLALRVGVYSLWLHKLRSALAILGILIGIVAVIWLVAMGEGVSRQAQEQIEGLGATNIIVRSVKPSQTGAASGRGGFFLEYGLKRADFRRIVSNLRDLEQAVQIREYRMEFRNGARTVEGRLVGCTPEYRDLNRLTVEYGGRFIEDRDGNPPNNVCVISRGVADALFPLKDPLGEAVYFSNDFYTVIGIVEPREATAAIGGSLDSQDFSNDIYIPIETWRVRIGDILFTSRQGSNEGEIVELNQITVSVREIGQVDHTADIIRNLLESEHPGLVDVRITVPKELLQQAAMLRTLFNALLVLIAGISLLVGGIGIMNIMLATVTERTREIGIRRALGAKRRDIIRQFLIEATLLTVVGGGLGMLIGALFPWVFALLKWGAQAAIPDLMEVLPPVLRTVEPQLVAWPFLVSFLISVSVGVFFGFYPAYRAAQLDPIEALRHE